MDDFSWVAPATKNIANLFGLNPELAAKGRNMQSENDLLLARTANTQADTNLSPYRQKVLEAQAAERAAMGGRHTADANKIGSEKALLDYELKARTGMAQAFLNGITRNPDGSVTMSPEAANQAMSGLASFAKNPEQFAEAGRVMMGNVSKIPREQSRLYKAPGSLESDAAYTAKEGQDIEAAKEAARTNRAVEVAKAKGIAENIATGGAPRAIDLTRAANDAVKIGPEYIQSRYGQTGFSMMGKNDKFPIPENLTLEITNAAQQKYPQLPINQAIDKVIAESGITFDTRGNYNPFVSNETRAYARPNANPQSDAELIDGSQGMTLADVFARSGGAPAAAPAAPAPAPVAPAAPRSTVPDSHKGAPHYSMQSVPGQPAQTAPSAPSAPAAPAAQGMPDKAQFAAIPEGGSVVIKGVTYVKRGRQLVKAQ